MPVILLKEIIIIRAQIELLKNKKDTITLFKKLNDFNDIAELLELPTEFLWKILIRDRNKKYKSFSIQKKSGTSRTIHSPNKNLAILQKKLAYVLDINFNPHSRAHGFVKQRSIISNAKEHVGNKYVLNFDLEDYFENISFRRVRHMFKAYFKFNDSVAATLANICCHPDGFLPQGGITSPIVSNILSKSMDKEITRLTLLQKYTRYTRYADDITISSNKREFPSELAFVDKDNNVVLSNRLLSIIEKYGYKVNPNKTRLETSYQSQQVTGIKVNQKINTRRVYIRRIRSILHTIEKNKHNLDNAHKIFYSKYHFRQRKKDEFPDMFQVLKGMISHVGNVKGKDDSVYRKLAARFNALSNLGNGISPLRILPSRVEFFEKYTYIIEDTDVFTFKDRWGNPSFECSEQGTGFLLKGVGIITNAHVLKPYIQIKKEGGKFDKEYYVMFRRSTDLNKLWAKILDYDEVKDIAVLLPENIDYHNEGFTYDFSLKKDQEIELIGFPKYNEGQEIKHELGKVNGIRSQFHQIRHEISVTIFGGNSGGPVVDMNKNVVGVAVRGAENTPNEIIPIKIVLEMTNKETSLP